MRTLGMQGEGDYLFHNRGDGTFEDVSKKAGTDDPQHAMSGRNLADYDNDGWPDLFLANDAGPNFLYHNRHKRHLRRGWHAGRRGPRQ